MRLAEGSFDRLVRKCKDLQDDYLTVVRDVWIMVYVDVNFQKEFFRGYRGLFYYYYFLWWWMFQFLWRHYVKSFNPLYNSVRWKYDLNKFRPEIRDKGTLKRVQWRIMTFTIRSVYGGEISFKSRWRLFNVPLCQPFLQLQKVLKKFCQFIYNVSFRF